MTSFSESRWSHSFSSKVLDHQVDIELTKILPAMLISEPDVSLAMAEWFT